MCLSWILYDNLDWLNLSSDDSNKVGICWLCRSRNCMRQQDIDDVKSLYKVLLQYYSVLQSTISVLLHYYKRTTTMYLPCTSKYYSTSTLYYKVLLRTTKFYSALQSTTPAPLCTMYYKLLLRTEASYMKWRSAGVIVQPSPNIAPATQNDSHAWSSSHVDTSFTMGGATGVTFQPHQLLRLHRCHPSELTNYCASQAKRSTCLISVTHEKWFAKSEATRITLQPHQILHLSRKTTHMLFPRHIWKLYLHCAEQQVSHSNLTKSRVPPQMTRTLDPRHRW